MKLHIIVNLVLVAATSSLGLSFSGGDGTSGNPYQIATQSQLDNVNNDLSASYVLVNDIDLSGTVYTAAVIAADQDDTDENFVGSFFTGSFDGAGFTLYTLI